MTVRDAATVMLVRDAPRLEVFMLRRNPRAVFGPGAYVFPGGAVDADDAIVPVIGRDPEVTDRLMTREGALRWWAAAAREAFEESGFLLAGSPQVGTTNRGLDDARAALNAGSTSFSAILRRFDAAVSSHSMHLFSHWLTPEGQPRRYDTWFLASRVPEGQIGSHDDAETVDSEWVEPREMLRRWRNDDIDLIFPTMRTLRILEQFDSTDALLSALQDAEAEAVAVGHSPWLIDDASGERVALHDHERGDARRGWRQLGSAWELDAELERADYADRDEGAA